MSNISVQFIFALVVAVASVSASFARQADSTAARNVPMTTLGSKSGKCFQGGPARAGAYNSAQFVHPEGVCRVPLDSTPGV
jgi:hypothetical protein